MKDSFAFGLESTNTILYCKQWEQTVRFYRDGLQLPVHFSTDWFVEFDLTAHSRLSLADETRASVKSSGGAGITLALEVKQLKEVWEYVRKAGLKPTPVRRHPWNAEVFYLFDPENHRIEIWQAATPE